MWLLAQDLLLGCRNKLPEEEKVKAVHLETIKEEMTQRMEKLGICRTEVYIRDNLHRYR